MNTAEVFSMHISVATNSLINNVSLVPVLTWIPILLFLKVHLLFIGKVSVQYECVLSFGLSVASFCHYVVSLHHCSVR